MTPTFLHALHGLAITKVPHAEALLDALNPLGRLRVVDLSIHRHASILSVELQVTGLDPIDAERWASEHVRTPILRLSTPLRRDTVGTLWFGGVTLDADLPTAWLDLELPFLAIHNPNRRDCWLTLTTSSDPVALEAWAKEHRSVLAENSVQRMLHPMLQQLDHFGVEAVAVGMSRAMLTTIEPMKAVSLLGSVAPVLYTSWLRAWSHTLALCAPQLKRVEAELVAEAAPTDALHWQPMIRRLRLVSTSDQFISVSPRVSETYWEAKDHARELAQLRAVTGASLDGAAAVVSFLEDTAALMLLQYRMNGATAIHPPRQGV